MRKKELIYPFLLNCCKYTEDSFWKIVFENLAYSKAPYGVYIFKDFLSCSYKDKEFSYKIDKNKSPQILYKEIKKLLKTKLGLCSNIDLQNKKELYENVEKYLETNRDDWKKIRRKNIKDQIIEEYIINNMKKFDITVREAQRLLSIITLSLQFKVITNKDIDYKDQQIYNITGINFFKKVIQYSDKMLLFVNN